MTIGDKGVESFEEFATDFRNEDVENREMALLLIKAAEDLRSKQLGLLDNQGSKDFHDIPNLLFADGIRTIESIYSNTKYRLYDSALREVRHLAEVWVVTRKLASDRELSSQLLQNLDDGTNSKNNIKLLKGRLNDLRDSSEIEEYGFLSSWAVHPERIDSKRHDRKRDVGFEKDILEIALKYTSGIVDVFQVQYSDELGRSKYFCQDELKELKGQISQLRNGY
jgi:hypothetical protein